MADNIHQFITRIKFISILDLLQVIPATVAYVVSLPIRWKHRNLWLVCERHNDARDNGYWFFKYLCEEHPEIEAVYAIDRNSPDRGKVVALGKVIDFGSFTHWLYYWMAEKNISSQKEGKPNAALCYIFEVYLGARKNRVYLKHGIIKDYQRWIFKDISKINLLICGAKREYDYINKEFGYSKDELVLTGLSRYDNLMIPHVVKRQILVMPTQREWLRTISSDTLKYEKSLDFTESEYFHTWSHLLASGELRNLLEQYQIDLLFYPHASMQQYVETFAKGCDRIIIGRAKDYDVQQLLMESAVLITDYSSIYFDFAYMEKPLIYYQFDYEKYRRGQYQQGYFSYIDDGFGPVAYQEEELIAALKIILEHDCKVEKRYLKRIKGFFAFHDSKNRERTYQAIQQMGVLTNKNKKHECKLQNCPPQPGVKKYHIGYTTGVYDMFHIGHLNILRRAKEQCEYLIVGVTTDALCYSRKKKYPIINESERIEIVEAIKHVDKVVLQEDMDKVKAVRELRADAVFVGSDWKGTDAWNQYEKEFAEVGCTVVYLDHTDGISSTILRDRLNKEE